MKNKKTVISMVSALCAFALVGGVSAINASANTVLDGFSCAGVSVNAEEVGVRFEFNLTGDATAKKDLDAGVVYMPYDLYTGDLANFTKDTAAAKTAEFGWEDNAETEADGDYVGYTYLAAESIPATMYNRVLLVRGYIVDGETVYYTSPVKASMADSAWKGIAALPDYEETLKAYMGPYTLTSEAGNVENLYYGDNVVAKLPTANAGKNIVAWYWDEAKTDDVAADDYATGSMAIYPKYESFVVSGVVSGADNLESVKVQINGADTDIAVAANGEYSVSLEAGTYDFRFYNDNFVAYVNDVAVSAATEVNATLVSNKWEAGTFGNVVGLPEKFDTLDMLDGSFTMAAQGGGVVFPNTATTNAFEYTAVIGAKSGRDQQAPMAVISTTYAHISVGMYQWGRTAYINVSDGTNIGTAFNEAFKVGALGDQNNTYTVKFVRMGTEIKCYINNVWVFTFTKDALVLGTDVTDKNWVGAANDVWTGWSKTSSFFAEDAKICAGVMNGFGVSAKQTATYTLSMSEFATVSGKVSLPEGSTLDLTATTLTVGGVAYDMTIDAEGNFTAYIPEGTQTLAFANGTWGATAADQVITLNATNTVNVTLTDYTWAPGTFGVNTGSASGYDKTDIDGSISVDGSNISVVFPNTATTGAFTYEATLSSVNRYGQDNEASPGIGITCGSVTVGITLRNWEGITLNVNTATAGAGEEGATFVNLSGTQNYANGTVIKIVRTAEDIKFYAKGSLIVTLTATGYTLAEGVTNYGWGDKFTSAWTTHGAKFFNGANVCAEITNGTKYACSATYTCSFTKN